MFISVTRTSAPSQPLSNISSLDGLLEPRIESFDWDTDFSDPSFVKFRARVSYVINLYNSPDGSFVTSMHAEGQNTEKAYLVAAGDSKQRLAAEQAMRNAMAKFVIDFQEQPEVKRWRSTHTSVPGNHQ
jgi:hypothetical protein